MSQPPVATIGVDIGGTKIAAGAISFPDGIVKKRQVVPTRPERGANAVLDDVKRLIRELAPADLQAIGLGVCEIVDPAGQLRSENCIPWVGRDVARELSRIAPTFVEADVRAAALAEALFGAGRGKAVVLYVTIGTGISSCLVIEGKPFAGARGASGTMASGLMPGSDRTLEQIASGPALVSHYNERGGSATSGRDVLAAAAEGNEIARSVVTSGADALGGSIGWLVNVLDPEMVVLGGGLGLSQGLYRDLLIDSARRHIWWPGHRDVPIVSAETGADAGIIGAAATAWRSLGAANCAAAV